MSEVLDEIPQGPRQAFERRMRYLLLFFGLFIILRSFLYVRPSNPVPAGGLRVVGVLVTLSYLGLIFMSWRLLPVFRQAPYPSVQRWSQWCYVGLGLHLIWIVARINAWFTLEAILNVPRYWLFLGSMALLLVEHYSQYRPNTKHWPIVYRTAQWWMALGFLWMGTDVVLKLYGQDGINHWGAAPGWTLGLITLFATGLMGILAYGLPKVEPPFRRLAWGYSLALLCLFVALEAQALEPLVRKVALLLALLIGGATVATANRS